MISPVNKWKPFSPGILNTVLPIGMLFLTLVASRVLLSLPEGAAYPALVELVLASAAWLGGVLFQPSDSGSSSLENRLRAALFWAIEVVGVFLTVTLLDPEIPVELVSILRLAAVLFFVLLFTVLLTTCSPWSKTGNRQVAFSIAAALCALPVWAGPLMEISSGPGLTTVVVSVSPVTVFATALDLDYLRTAWFYSNSPLGSLRYDYLSWSTYVLTLTGLISGLIFATLRTGSSSPGDRYRENTS